MQLFVIINELAHALGFHSAVAALYASFSCITCYQYIAQMIVFKTKNHLNSLKCTMFEINWSAPIVLFTEKEQAGKITITCTVDFFAED
jgi:hypothetical protein